VGEECTQEVADLLDVCLRTNVDERPSAKELVARIQVLVLAHFLTILSDPALMVLRCLVEQCLSAVLWCISMVLETVHCISHTTGCSYGALCLCEKERQSQRSATDLQWPPHFERRLCRLRLCLFWTQALPPQPNPKARKGSTQSFASPLDRAQHASSGGDSSVLSADTNGESKSASNFKFYQVRRCRQCCCKAVDKLLSSLTLGRQGRKMQTRV
jgi:hypothetical protein